MAVAVGIEGTPIGELEGPAGRSVLAEDDLSGAPYLMNRQRRWADSRFEATGGKRAAATTSRPGSVDTSLSRHSQ